MFGMNLGWVELCFIKNFRVRGREKEEMAIHCQKIQYIINTKIFLKFMKRCFLVNKLYLSQVVLVLQGWLDNKIWDSWFRILFKRTDLPSTRWIHVRFPGFFCFYIFVYLLHLWSSYFLIELAINETIMVDFLVFIQVHKISLLHAGTQMYINLIWIE